MASKNIIKPERKPPNCFQNLVFLHTVSVENRFFESSFEKTISSRDRLQKLRNLSLFHLFYSITFLMPKRFFLEKKFVKVFKIVKIGPQGSGKLLWQLSRAFFRCACPNNIVFVERIACQGAFWAPWRFLALPGGSSRLAGCLCVPLGAPAAPGGPWRPLVPPGAPWRPLVVPGASCPPLAAPGGSWRPLVPPGASWRPLAAPGVCPWRCWSSEFAFSMRFPSVFYDSSVWLAPQIHILVVIPKCFL